MRYNFKVLESEQFIKKNIFIADYEDGKSRFKVPEFCFWQGPDTAESRCKRQKGLWLVASNPFMRLLIQYREFLIHDLITS